MELSELKKFLAANNLKLDIEQVHDDEEETTYQWVGYMGDIRIFDNNEFYVKKSVKLDVFNSDALDLVAVLGHAEWVYELFLNTEGCYPLLDYVDRDFKFVRLEDMDMQENKNEAQKHHPKQLLKDIEELGYPEIVLNRFGGTLTMKPNAHEVGESHIKLYQGDCSCRISYIGDAYMEKTMGPDNIIVKCRKCYHVYNKDDSGLLFNVYWPEEQQAKRLH